MVLFGSIAMLSQPRSILQMKESFCHRIFHATWSSTQGLQDKLLSPTRTKRVIDLVGLTPFEDCMRKVYFYLLGYSRQEVKYEKLAR